MLSAGVSMSGVVDGRHSGLNGATDPAASAGCPAQSQSSAQNQHPRQDPDRQWLVPGKRAKMKL